VLPDRDRPAEECDPEPTPTLKTVDCSRRVTVAYTAECGFVLQDMMQSVRGWARCGTFALSSQIP
jgi:hypothetical protein